MADVDHLNRAYDETTKMRFFLQGVSASAIAFVFHETSDWSPSIALYLAALAAILWAGSFAAGVRGSMHRQMTHMKAFGLEIFRGPRFASPSRVTDVDKQLAEHDDWRGWYFLRLEPHFFGFNIDQTLEDGLQAERLDVGVFDIFLGLRASKGSE